MRFVRTASSPVSPRAFIEGALAVLVIGAAALGGWRIAHPPRAQAASVPGAAIDAAPLGRFDAFFRNGAPATGAGQSGDAAAAGWRLTGTRAGGSPSAILERPDGTQAAFRLGEMVGAGLTLKAVSVDHVILTGPGGDHRLEFVDGPPPPPPEPVQGAAAAPALSADAAQAAAAMGAAPPVADVYVQALRPQTSGGRVEGYVWRRGAPGGALSGLGLREGDVILSVDGEPLTSPERVWELGPALASGRPVTLRYRRAGQERTATFSPTTD